MPTQGPSGPPEPTAQMSMSSARAAVLDAVRERGRLCSVREIAEEFELHPNTVREHLDALLDQGLVARESARPTGRGRPALMYRATSAAEDVARDYELLTKVLSEQIASMPNGVEVARQAGRTWGDAQVAGADGVRPTDLGPHVARLGFEPTQPDATGRLVLRACPILSAARRNPEIVCTVHLGFVEAMVEAAGGDPDDIDLAPMGDPAGCVLRVGALARPQSEGTVQGLTAAS